MVDNVADPALAGLLAAGGIAVENGALKKVNPYIVEEAALYDNCVNVIFGNTLTEYVDSRDERVRLYESSNVESKNNTPIQVYIGPDKHTFTGSFRQENELRFGVLEHSHFGIWTALAKMDGTVAGLPAKHTDYATFPNSFAGSHSATSGTLELSPNAEFTGIVLGLASYGHQSLSGLAEHMDLDGLASLRLSSASAGNLTLDFRDFYTLNGNLTIDGSDGFTGEFTSISGSSPQFATPVPTAVAQYNSNYITGDFYGNSKGGEAVGRFGLHHYNETEAKWLDIFGSFGVIKK